MDDEVFAEQLASIDGAGPINAVLNPDGSLDVELAVPGYDEPQELHIDGTKTLLWLSGFEPQAVDLAGTDKVNAEARRVIDQHLAALKDRMRRRLVAAREAQRATVGSERTA